MSKMFSPSDCRPDVEGVAPEVVLEVFRVLDPEDQEVPHDHDGVQEDDELEHKLEFKMECFAFFDIFSFGHFL
jgi:hypothetical protein